jgi:hypothetical protein
MLPAPTFGAAKFDYFESLVISDELARNRQSSELSEGAFLAIERIRQSVSSTTGLPVAKLMASVMATYIAVNAKRVLSDIAVTSFYLRGGKWGNSPY